MKLINHFNKNYIVLGILISTLILILPKWILSFYFFDESMTLRIINEVSDISYFPIINSFSDFNFANSYSNNLTKLKLISFPAIGLFINTFFFKIFGSYSFIFLELACTALFLFIFYNIFLSIDFNRIVSFKFAIFLFILPSVLSNFDFLNINALKLLSLNFETFYSTRFPRPAISNLFFFSFIFFVIKFYKEEKNYIKNLYFITFFMGLTINIFFYLFFIEFFLMICIFYFKFTNKIFKIIFSNYKHFLHYLLIILFFVGIFQLQIFYSEPDYIKRLGVFQIDLHQKKILFKYLFDFFLGFKFLLLLLVNIFFFVISKNNFKKIFFFLFIASVISPIFFFIIFNKGVDYYHFFNWIVVYGFLFPTISVLYILNVNLNKYLTVNQNKILSIFLVPVMLLYYALNTASMYKFDDKNVYIQRYKLNETVNFISNNKSFIKKNIEILNFNHDLTIWFMLNDYNNFSFIPISFWTPKTDKMLEEELISSIKFLGLDKEFFYNLIKNKRKSWRFKNNFSYNYFGRKYMANSLIVFNKDKSDYEPEEKNFIKSNNLLITHQIIIPKSEMNRLLNKFDSFNAKINPDFFIIDKNGLFNAGKFKNKNFCIIFDNKQFVIFSNKKLNNKCLLVKN